MLPESLEIKDWINTSHINQDCWLKKEPFEHAQIENFFLTDIFKKIQNTINSINEEFFSFHPNTVYKFATFPSKSFLKFIYSQNFKDFMENHIGLRLLRCKSYAYPQVYVFNNQGKELKIHTDYNPQMPRSFGMIFYMHEHWEKDYGGILHLYSKDELTKPAVTYQPIPNSCILFRVSQYSYHALTHAKSSWKRVTLIVDWDLEEKE